MTENNSPVTHSPDALLDQPMADPGPPPIRCFNCGACAEHQEILSLVAGCYAICCSEGEEDANAV